VIAGAPPLHRLGTYLRSFPPINPLDILISQSFRTILWFEYVSTAAAAARHRYLEHLGQIGTDPMFCAVLRAFSSIRRLPERPKCSQSLVFVSIVGVLHIPLRWVTRKFACLPLSMPKSLDSPTSPEIPRIWKHEALRSRDPVPSFHNIPGHNKPLDQNTPKATQLRQSHRCCSADSWFALVYTHRPAKYHKAPSPRTKQALSTVPQ
jgi:hypothetical protein